MAKWKPGESGNINGVRREQPFRKALDRAIAQDTAGRLRACAEKLLTMASEGVPWAVSMLAEKLDGKADQTINIVRRAAELSDDDLLRIAAGSSEGNTSEKVSEEVSSKVH